MIRYIFILFLFVFISLLLNKRDYFTVGLQSTQCPYDEIYDDVSGSCVPRKQCNKEMRNKKYYEIQFMCPVI